MTKQEMERIKRTVIRKYPIFASVALLNIPIEEDSKIPTAAVCAEKTKDGKIVLKGIKYNSDFFDNLTFEQQVFVLAHETCHIAFKHFSRSLDKPEKDVERKYQEYCKKNEDENLRSIELMKLRKKYYNYWNIATDACINAFLKKDGLEAPQSVIDKKTGQSMQIIDIADGLYRRAELIYDSLVEKNNQQEQNNQYDNNNNAQQAPPDNEDNNNVQQSPSDSSKGDRNIDNFDIDDYQGVDSHEEWVSEPKETNEQKNKKEQEEKSKSFLEKIKEFFKNEKNKNDKKERKETDFNDNSSVDEKDMFNKNEKFRNKRDNKTLNEALNNIIKEANLDKVTYTKPIVSWKQILIRSIDEETEQWGYRRANKNMPNARIEDRLQEERSTTEVILDTSDSVSDELLREFLRQLFPLFQETKIKVGCFSGKFHGFTELQNIKDIQDYKPTRDANGTNFEAAVTAFTNNKQNQKINKIVFTDGMLDHDASHRQKTKIDGIIWIVYGNEMDFKPLSGKIIKVNKSDLNRMISITQVEDKQFSFENKIENQYEEIHRRKR